jgi:hypothetical protein
VAGDGARGYTLRGAGMRALDGLVPREAAVCRRVCRCPPGGVETGAGRSASAPSPLALAVSRCRRGREAEPAPPGRHAV